MTSPDRRTKRLGLLASFGALIAAANLTVDPPQARADASSFMAELESVGMPYDVAQASVEAAESACRLLDVQPTLDSMGFLITTFETRVGLTEKASRGFVTDAANQLCPRHDDIVQQWTLASSTRSATV